VCLGLEELDRSVKPDHLSINLPQLSTGSAKSSSYVIGRHPNRKKADLGPNPGSQHKRMGRRSFEEGRPRGDGTADQDPLDCPTVNAFDCRPSFSAAVRFVCVSDSSCQNAAFRAFRTTGARATAGRPRILNVFIPTVCAAREGFEARRPPTTDRRLGFWSNK